MIQLDDITFIKYFELEDKSEYDYAIKYSFTFNNPIDHFGIGDLMKCPFGIIKDIQFDLQEGLSFEKFIEYINQLTGKKVYNQSLLKVCQQKSFLLKAVEELIKVEEISFRSTLTADEQNAGIEDFDGFGIELQFRSLTGGDVTKKELIRNLPYEDCFVELVLQKKISEYEKRLHEIRNRRK